MIANNEERDNSGQILKKIYQIIKAGGQDRSKFLEITMEFVKFYNHQNSYANIVLLDSGINHALSSIIEVHSR